MNDEKLFKFQVHTTEYLCLLNEDITGIRALLGDFEVVKVRKCWACPWRMNIWVKRKNTGVQRDFNNMASDVPFTR